jgi:tRNA threonylcarbamoyladenosine biosynthesis protein TsaE
MLDGVEMTLFLPDDDATLALGHRLAAALRPGDLVLLSGELGAGKSSLARAIIRALANDARLEVPSPSFSLVQPYETPRGPVLHADLYRLSHPDEALELGLFDTQDAIVLIEWPERAPELFRHAALRVSLSIPPGGAGRLATLDAAPGRRF